MKTYLYYHMITIHSLPFIGVLMNVIISRIVFIPGHCVYLSLFGLFYCIVNFLGTKYRGHFLYPFLPWTDYKSIIVSLLIVVVGAIIYLVVCFVLYRIKLKPEEHNLKSQSSFYQKNEKNNGDKVEHTKNE